MRALVPSQRGHHKFAKENDSDANAREVFRYLCRGSRDIKHLFGIDRSDGVIRNTRYKDAGRRGRGEDRERFAGGEFIGLGAQVGEEGKQ